MSRRRRRRRLDGWMILSTQGLMMRCLSLVVLVVLVGVSRLLSSRWYVMAHSFSRFMYTFEAKALCCCCCCCCSLTLFFFFFGKKLPTHSEAEINNMIDTFGEQQQKRKKERKKERNIIIIIIIGIKKRVIS